ncbi:MAG TPA: hypothetical protein PLO37_07730 [Candidatus Hydrogenedentes bacterium]|nr:hypothetical protein [Candidatus Hydrogenedentota bacterium]HPG66721.1 hypothetical protein [Candidatus Hydrogenedentota bacterium]
MVRKQAHCQAITRKPELAQAYMTSLNLKLNAVLQMIDTALAAQGQAAWKVFYPIGYQGEDTSTNTSTTTNYNSFI